MFNQRKPFLKNTALWSVMVSLILCVQLIAAPVQTYEEAYGTLLSRQGSVSAYIVTDGAGANIYEIPTNETVFVAQKELTMYEGPGSNTRAVAKYRFGAELVRFGICENGYSHVILYGKSGNYEGYVETRGLSDTQIIEKVETQVSLLADSEILDYPSRRDGEVVGKALASQVLDCTGVMGGVWTRVTFRGDGGVNQVGYIQTDLVTNSISQGDNGTLTQGSGSGVFYEAADKVTQTIGNGTTTIGVIEGVPEMLGGSVTLKSMGVFRITHYCPCSICCGPYADGITSTGGTAVTNHTIAVSPSQIPYGSRVVINGQVYVAEDCGGAIKDNCIDVYVATHEEALARGVFYTEVFVIQ